MGPGPATVRPAAACAQDGIGVNGREPCKRSHFFLAFFVPLP